MSKHVFTTEQLTATKWESAQSKADFLNSLANFMRSGFKRARFTKKLYQRLSNTFGHIAHYNIDGFYAAWFESTASQLAWINHVGKYGCYGDPEYTYSDAERQFQKWLESEEATAIFGELAKKDRQRRIDEAREMKARAEATLEILGA